MAGVGIYEDYTPAELYYRAKAISSSQWDHTSVLLAKIHNILAKKKISPRDVHPYGREKQKMHKTKEEFIMDLHSLKKICGNVKKG